MHNPFTMHAPLSPHTPLFCHTQPPFCHTRPCHVSMPPTRHPPCHVCMVRRPHMVRRTEWMTHAYEDITFLITFDSMSYRFWLLLSSGVVTKSSFLWLRCAVLRVTLRVTLEVTLRVTWRIGTVGVTLRVSTRSIFGWLRAETWPITLPLVVPNQNEIKIGRNNRKTMSVTPWIRIW